jgi:hypothetical protein
MMTCNSNTSPHALLCRGSSVPEVTWVTPGEAAARLALDGPQVGETLMSRASAWLGITAEVDQSGMPLCPGS